MRNITALLILAWLGPALSAGDWLHWRGPEQTGVSRERDLPEKWSESKGGNLIWKAPYGSRSTPLVMGGRIYLINDVESGITEQERVVCLDEKTGALLWEKRFNVFLVDIVSSRVGWTNLAGDAETGYLYTHGTQGFLTCFDKDGKIIWQRSLIEECGRICGYGGRLSSPIVDEGLVIVGIVNASFGDQARGSNRFLAVDKRTGQTVWWADTGNQINDTYYSNPVVAVIGGQRLIISGGGDGFVHAFKVRTGEKVWNYPLAAKAVNSSPVVDGDLVYVGNGEENYEDSSIQGRIVCLNGAKVTKGVPEVVWKLDEIKATFASPFILEGRLYMPEENGKLYCFDGKTGKELWKVKYGRVARGSPVWADGKIYIPDVNARFVILKPGAKKCEKLHEKTFSSADGSVVEINGSPAIVNGRIYLPTADALYCIGKEGHKTPPDAIPPAVKEEPADKDAEPARLLAFPGDVTLRPGESVSYKVSAFDAKGRFLREVKADWSLPAPPPPPGTNVAPPPLKGVITPEGKLTVDAVMKNQQGPAVAKVGKVEARARVRVLPPLPFSQDFEGIPVGRAPGGWVNCQGKFVVEKLNGSNVLRKTTVNPNPLLARANAYMSLPTSTDYTVESDIMGGLVGKNLPDMGLTAQRYTLSLSGNRQQLRLVSWDALPRIEKAMSWQWKPNVWYRMKLTTEIQSDKAIVRGKVWPKDQEEPKAWTIEVEDPRPNREGAPALYGSAVGLVENQLTPIWYDNVKVTTK